MRRVERTSGCGAMRQLDLPDGLVRRSASSARWFSSPLSPRRYKLAVTLDEETRDDLAELQDLCAHDVPDGDPAVIVKLALRALLVQKLKKKAALTHAPEKPRPEAIRDYGEAFMAARRASRRERDPPRNDGARDRLGARRE
jgi:hypothetical protein